MKLIPMNSRTQLTGVLSFSFRAMPRLSSLSTAIQTMKASPIANNLPSPRVILLLASLAWLTTLIAAPADAYEENRNPLAHPIHSNDRPRPPVVDPGPAVPPAPVPSDAIVLFDGTGFDHWQSHKGEEVPWNLVDGAMQVVPGSGDILTRERFGDVQLYIEFNLDPDSPGSGQSKSNSGVFFGPYEVQVLDSFENPAYPDGQAASIYGQYPPLVNASRAPGEWQSYNIIYRAPRFQDGVAVEPARITVFHNNVLVQDSEPLIGPTSHNVRTHYQQHGDVPIRLQDHDDDPILFRNIWLREL